MTTEKEVACDFDEEAVTSAMRARIGHFKEQADSLTLEGVRRVLEKDLGLEQFALDAHKRFIKQCLHECFEATNDENISKSSGETGEEAVISTKEEELDLSEKLNPLQKLGVLGDKEATEGSPVAGVDTALDDTKKSEHSGKALSENTIKKTIRKRAAYFRANSESISLAGARRLLEGDLKLDNHALDSHRELIKEELDKVLQGQSSGVAEPANGIKKNKRKKSEGSPESLDSTDELEEEEKPKKKPALKTQNPKGLQKHKRPVKDLDELEEEETKLKKKPASKPKGHNSEGLKNQKGPGKEIMKSSNKPKRPVESTPRESDDADDGGDLSEDGRSESSVEEPVKKKSEPSTQVYGKRVEHLKSVIRSCGMSVPPTVYKRAKQAPETKREAILIKELEEMLKKEGLSTNPSEKEIKEVKRRKERTKELEGIELSNIVSSSRRRSTSSFVPPPQPKISVGSDDDEDNNDEEEEEEDDDDDESDDGSNSEDLNEDVEDESD